MASRPAGGLRGALSAPAGYGAAPRSKQYVSNFFHGFFITINSRGYDPIFQTNHTH